MGLEIRLKKGDAFVVDGEYKITSIKNANGVTTLVIESLGDQKPVVKIIKGEDRKGRTES